MLKLKGYAKLSSEKCLPHTFQYSEFSFRILRFISHASRNSLVVFRCESKCARAAPNFTLVGCKSFQKWCERYVASRHLMQLQMRTDNGMKVHLYYDVKSLKRTLKMLTARLSNHVIRTSRLRKADGTAACSGAGG